MTAYNLSIEDAPKAEDIQVLAQGLTAHALPHTQVPGFLPIGVFLRDDQNRIVGGVWGYINWNWLFIGLVWTADSIRGQGYGRQMIETLESVARERGCRHSHLDTFSYQARPFYEHLGYEVFGTLDDYPPGHQRYFMKKKLVD